MTDVKITELPLTSTASGSDTLVVVQAGITRRIAIADAVAAELAGVAGLAQVKQGTPWWDSVFAAPPAADVPTVSISTATAIAGGTAVLPTPDYFGDPFFRYDGCADVASAGTNLVKAVQPAADGAAYPIVPEFVTSQGVDRIDVGFTLNAAGSTFGVRVSVNGRWLAAPVQWFSTTASTLYWVHLTFPSAASRQIRVETVNSGNFAGVVVPAGESTRRPAREVRKRMVVLGDSYASGANANTTADPATNGCSWFETFPNYVAKLLGCDSIINLGVGGTGWVNVGTHTVFGARIGDVLAASPHIVLAAGSRNDSTATAAAVYTAAVSALTQFADVPVVEVCGIEDTGSSSGTAAASLNEAVKQAARTAGRHFNDVLGVITTALKNTADSVHPSVLGAQTLAASFYGLLDRSLVDETVAAAVGGRVSIDLTLTASPSSTILAGNPVTLTATQSSARSGKVTFYANGVLIGSANTSGGTASVSTSALAVGSYTFTARFVPSNPITVKSTTAALTGYTVATNLGFTDSFTRANGPIGSTENGKVYAVTGTGAWVITSNAAGNPTVSSGTSYAVVDAGTPNGTYQVTIGGTSVTAALIALRYQSSNNLLKLNVQSSQITLQQTVGGVTTTLFTGTSGAWVAGDVIAVTLAGDTITVKKNGTVVTGLNAVTVSQFDTNTLFGFGAATSGIGVTYDNLSFA